MRTPTNQAEKTYFSVHKDEEEVVQIKKCTKLEQDIKVMEIMKEGMQKFNKEECNKENPNFQRVKAGKGDCRECQSCGGCFSCRFFFRHQKQCQKDGLVPPKPRDLLQCQSDVSPEFLELLDSLHFDEV